MNHILLRKLAAAALVFLLFASPMVLTGFTTAPTTNDYAQALAQVVPESKSGSLDLETFTDNLISRQLKDYPIPGAMVSIVQDGRVVLSKGYGYANIAQQIPVTPDDTLFRIGSASKLFTWTAVMQLVEQGKIDLEADVNTYLPDFQIPATFPEPVTMHHLMSHSAGFEDRYIGNKAHGPEEMVSLHDYLVKSMPARVRPVGEVVSYSNYGAALAGYIVEAVSGMPFAQYIETQIFDPLSMSHSSFRQPLPPNLIDKLASSYSFNGEYRTGEFTYAVPAPAGAMSSTADDMAKFMLAHLQDGKLDNEQILKAETARLMHTHLFSTDERLDGFAYGFFQDEKTGILWHGGDIGDWHSMLVLMPAQSLGFFVAYNSAAGIQAVAEFVTAFLTTYLPPQEAVDPAPAEIPFHDPKELTGDYRSTRNTYDHLERITQIIGDRNVHIAANPDRSLSISASGVPGIIFTEQEPFVYKSLAGDMLTFHRDADGKIALLQFLSDPSTSYEPIPWYEAPKFTLQLFAACLVLLLSALLAAFFGIFRRRKPPEDFMDTQPGKQVQVESGLPRLARIWAVLLSAAFILAWAAAVYYAAVDITYSLPPYMLAVLVLVLAASILVVGPMIFTTLAWRRRYWSLAGRIHYTLVTAALLGMVWLLYTWRLLGFRM